MDNDRESNAAAALEERSPENITRTQAAGPVDPKEREAAITKWQARWDPTFTTPAATAAKQKSETQNVKEVNASKMDVVAELLVKAVADTLLKQGSALEPGIRHDSDSTMTGPSTARQSQTRKHTR